ncbi:MAG: autotransporter-associated beta strand repeat-containing protein, partial [Verrucomicrobiia bacterium]
MKVNQRGEGSGRQSSPVVLWTIILMAVGLSLLFSGAAQAQLSFTNVASGKWTVSTVWGVNAPDGGSNDYTIVFTNTLPDLSSNNLANPFQLNQLIFAPPAQPVTLSSNGLQFSFSTSNGTLPQVLQNSTNDMTINVNIGLDTNITFAGTGSGGVTVNGAISGSYRLTKSGSYILTLTTNNSYSGGTVINNGAVAFTATNRAPQSGTITVNSSGSVWFQDGNVPPQLDKSSAGGLAVGTGAGSTNYDFSTSGLSNMALVAAQTLTNDYPLTPSGNEYRIGALSGTTFTYTNQLTGAYSLNIGPGGGTVVLTNFSNTFTGSTTIRDGTVLLIIADNNIGAGNTNLILSSGGTLWVAGSFTLNNRPVTVNASGGGINVDG